MLPNGEICPLLVDFLFGTDNRRGFYVTERERDPTMATLYQNYYYLEYYSVVSIEISICRQHPFRHGGQEEHPASNSG